MSKAISLHRAFYQIGRQSPVMLDPGRLTLYTPTNQLNFGGYAHTLWRSKMASSLNGKNILLVDDDKDMLTALTTVLDGTGAEVETASDGNEAIEAATEFDPDLVVLDAMLPKRSGFLVLEKLKTTKKRGVRPLVIMITGNSGKRHQTWAESLGVDGYLNKPFRMERLVEQMETLLAKN